MCLDVVGEELCGLLDVLMVCEDCYDECGDFGDEIVGVESDVCDIVCGCFIVVCCCCVVVVVSVVCRGFGDCYDWGWSFEVVWIFFVFCELCLFGCVFDVFLYDGECKGFGCVFV